MAKKPKKLWNLQFIPAEIFKRLMSFPVSYRKANKTKGRIKWKRVLGTRGFYGEESNPKVVQLINQYDVYSPLRDVYPGGTESLSFCLRSTSFYRVNSDPFFRTEAIRFVPHTHKLCTPLATKNPSPHLLRKINLIR